MTLAYLSGNRLSGLSTDSKPSTLPTTSKFYETDTGLEWEWDGIEWVLPQMKMVAGMKKFGEINFRGALPAVGGGAISTTAAYFGTNTAAIGTTFGTLDIMDTTTTINTLSGFRCLSFTSRFLNPSLKIMFRLNHITNVRLFIGLHNQVGSNPTTNADPFAAGSGIGCGLWLDSAVSGDYKIATNDGGNAVSTLTPFTTPVTADVSTRILEIRGVDASTKFQARLGTAAWTDISTDIPAQTGTVGFIMWIENTAAEQKTCYVPIIKVRMDQP
jgi:hypothetical protein